jgi:tripartite-type tricarboxylate transporter receptor subunit TctC
MLDMLLDCYRISYTIIRAIILARGEAAPQICIKEDPVRLLLMFATLAFPIGSALTQDYPTRPVNIVVPAAAGGPTDTISRITAQAMSKVLGQQFTIENVGGAGGTIGTARVARAEPDGYTLLIYHVGLATAATLYRKLPYDTRSAFAAVGLITDAPMTIIGRSDLEPSSLGDLIPYLERSDTKTTFGNAGIGSASHLCGMLLASVLHIQLTTVPYRGTGPVMNDLIGKQIDMTCDQATNTTGPIQGNQVKGYAVTTRSRLPSLPALPTANEAGLPGFELAVWHGLFAPKGTPPAIVQKLSAALAAALKDPGLVKRYKEISTEPMPEDKATPEAAQRTLMSEIDRWAPIINAAGEYAD